MEEKHKTLARMMDKFRELSQTSANDYTVINELYTICKEDFLDDAEMIDIEEYSCKLSEL